MIRYREGYKYVLHEDYTAQTSVKPAQFVYAPLLRLDSDGVLYIQAGYAWDGPSGPAFDTPNFMRASLVHDALYQILSEGYISQDFRDEADDTMYRICREDGMTAIRAWWCYQAVRVFGGEASTAVKEVLTAP